MKQTITVLFIALSLSATAQKKLNAESKTQNAADSTKPIVVNQNYYIAVYQNLMKMKSASEFFNAPNSDVKALDELISVTKQMAIQLTTKEQPKK